MGKCPGAELVSAGALGFLLAAPLPTLLALGSVCRCAVREIATIASHPALPGLSASSAERRPVLSTARQANSSGEDYLFTTANTIGSNDFIGNL